ncbi:MAG: metal ABC transporter permease [Gemmatimonadetes bacterium]|nr:MAG: metal ABC transporter permease [Gemmatimonadota bacterium]
MHVRNRLSRRRRPAKADARAGMRSMGQRPPALRALWLATALLQLTLPGAAAWADARLDTAESHAVAHIESHTTNSCARIHAPDCALCHFLTAPFHPEEAERLGWKIKWWDFLFYLSFGVVITLAVPVAGVLMVFSFLVVPAVIAFMFTRDMKRLAYISWGSGALASVLGLWLSLAGDLPTGPLIVCMYGIVLVGAVALRKLMRAPA